MLRREPHLTSRLQGFGTTIFAEMSALAISTGSVNLGQGFPDYDGPREVLQAAADAILAGHNQYPPGPGIPALRQAISEHQRRFYGLSVDPDGEVFVTTGATEALAATIFSLCEAGDEVLMFEPSYDSYTACVAMAGATPRLVTLRPPVYAFDPDELRAAINPKTRFLLLNTPHNPTGKVFGREELQFIADLAIEHDLIVVTDEVYEHLVYDGVEHVPLASLPGMWERTLTISSLGKTFNTTGWKIGWVTGPRSLVNCVRTAKQFLTYVSGTPFQHAAVVALNLPDAYYTEVAADLQVKRDHVMAGLTEAGFTVFKPSGTYFVTVDIRPLGETDGFAFCRSLPERCGVVGIPNVVFYGNKAEGRHLVRFAFCKRLELIDDAVARLKGLSR